LIPWACFPPKNYVSIFFEFLLYYFNQACFKSNRTSENHVRKGKKEKGKKQRSFENKDILRNKESSLSSEKKKNIFLVFFFAKTIGFVWCTSLVLFFYKSIKTKIWKSW
jgi:hypothetical protein